MQASPVQFIKTNKAGTFEICQDAMAMLQEIENPVAAIAIAGKYRSGKSFFMNQILGRNSGFPIGGTIQSRTKGVWIWIKSHPMKTDTSLILLDTEGLYDVEKDDTTDDCKLLALAMLLSSCFVFNVTKSIDDAVIQQLHLGIKLVENMAEKNKTVCLDEFFPNFVMVVRDFDLILEIDQEACSSDEYLENALTPKSKQHKDYNIPRFSITETFQNRKCFVLPRPVENEEKLKALDTVKNDDLSRKFVQQAEIAVRGILDAAVQFKLNEIVISGKSYADFAQVYVDAINKGEIPNIETAFEGMRKIQCHKALESSLQIYEGQMKEQIQYGLPVSTYKIDQIYLKARAMAEEAFQQECLSDPGDIFFSEFKAHMEVKYREISDKNNQLSQEACKAALSTHFEDIERKFHTGVYLQNDEGHELYKDDLKQAISEFKSEPNLGPLQISTLTEKLELMQMNEKTLAKFHEDMRVKNKEIATIQEETARHNHKLENNIQSLTEMLDHVNATLKQKDGQILQLIEERDSQKQLVYSRERELESSKQNVETLSQKVQHLETVNTSNSKIIKDQTAETQRYKSTGDQQRNEILTLKQSHQDLLTEHNNSKTAQETHIGKLNNTLQERNNEIATLRHTGSTGKFYCGGMLESRCRCCDGHCGPTNGHNCRACAQLR